MKVPLLLFALSLLFPVVASANKPVLVCWNLEAPQNSICVDSVYDTFHDRLQESLQADAHEQNLRGTSTAKDDICQEVCQLGASYDHLWFQVGCSPCDSDQHSTLSPEADSSFHEKQRETKKLGYGAKSRVEEKLKSLALTLDLEDPCRRVLFRSTCELYKKQETTYEVTD